MTKTGKKITRDWFENWSNEYDRTLGSLKFHRDLLDLVVKNSGVRRESARYRLRDGSSGLEIPQGG
jgi:hypothetical protein